MREHVKNLAIQIGDAIDDFFEFTWPEWKFFCLILLGAIRDRRWPIAQTEDSELDDIDPKILSAKMGLARYDWYKERFRLWYATGAGIYPPARPASEWRLAKWQRRVLLYDSQGR